MSTHTPAISAAIAAPTIRGTFDYNTTSASAIVFEASIPEASYCLPCCGVISFVNDYFSPFLHANVSPVICFLTVCSVDMFHETVRDPLGDFPSPPFNFSVCFVPMENSPLIPLCMPQYCPHISVRQVPHYEGEYLSLIFFMFF